VLRYRILLPLLALTLAHGVVPAGAQDHETTEVADGVYQFRWTSHNAMFVASGSQVLVFDPINPEAATTFAEEIRRVVPGARLAGIVYSHHHSDHATGGATLMEAFGQDDVPVYAHVRAVEPIAGQDAPDQPTPTVTFGERLRFPLGERTVELRYLGPSHTDNMIVGFVPDARVAFAVDFVSNDRVGYRDLPGWRYPAFFGALTDLLELPFDTIVYGHGPPSGRGAIHRQIAYYDDLRAAVRRAVDEGMSESEAARRIELPAYEEWDGYDDWFELNVRAMHRWLSDGGG